ncbi:hypothetical protein CBM2592_B40234 [Cupriavidus taiwanensis]|nr:hypothetical protein CBM2592_B40234 [Cupriavidus taiwanensis]SOY72097.1 hypothetical protein CBM2588_B40052 [Cupriavidus taiwanensis]SOY95661.1 hypothetical protein CBM2591_B20232 [Cupriavidus taiwanensis]SOZ74788.1 hypothetical protein CBM2617_B60149 [Cupriavidus taiwanensis]SOZ88407.1 hypothetical protein CBM2618_B50151 [Cupriavidus taiwanensis]
MRYLRTALRQLEQRCGALKMCQVIQGESQRDSGRARHWLSECRTPRRFFAACVGSAGPSRSRTQRAPAT